MTRPDPRLGALRAALEHHHTDPQRPIGNPAFAEPVTPGIGMPAPRRTAAAEVLPLRPDADTPLQAAPLHVAPAPIPAADVAFEDTEAGADVVALVHLAQAGDSQAFGDLYDRYVDVVYRYVYYRVGTQTLAEDLVSETFLRALRRIGSFSWQGRDFAAWLITIARNLIADHFKSGRYRLEVATADMLDADRAQDGPEQDVLDGITNATLLEAVKQLNAEQQECVVLRFLQGMSVTETALAMSKTEGAIKALQFRAVRTLGRLLPRELIL